MNEPTREQIKEAFKETIERWEKIVEDVEYYKGTDCQLPSTVGGALGVAACHPVTQKDRTQYGHDLSIYSLETESATQSAR